MKKFTGIEDVCDLQQWLKEARDFKKNPFLYPEAGKQLTLGLVFLNPSLRTRLSTQKAAQNLGMHVLTMDLNKDGWQIETRDGIVMNGNSQEHLIEAAGVLSQYCDILGVRTFPGLVNREADYEEQILQQFIRYTTVPVISLESATLHPLQSFADLITIDAHKKTAKPKVVLTWAPHVKALPQSVPNSFAQWMQKAEVELVIANPEGFDLAPEFTQGVTVLHDQDLALENADFVYAKNWSSYSDYGATGDGYESWMITTDKMKRTNQAKLMHCLPVRRNVVVSDTVLDGPDSLVLEQANNRTFAAQTVLWNIIKELKSEK